MFANGGASGATDKIRGFFAPLRMTEIVYITAMVKML